MLGTGEYFYFMQAGTGETVVLPLYLLLQRRGVRFEFFHRLVGVTSVDDPTSPERQSIDELEFERQAELNEHHKENGEYSPLLTLPGHNYRVWPHQPRWEVLTDPGRTAGSTSRCGARGEEDMDGATRPEFDYVIWAIPPSMIRLVGDNGCARMGKHPRPSPPRPQRRPSSSG